MHHYKGCPSLWVAPTPWDLTISIWQTQGWDVPGRRHVREGACHRGGMSGRAHAIEGACQGGGMPSREHVRDGACHYNKCYPKVRQSNN